MVGAAAAGCADCPKVAGIFPLVPIVPDIHAEVHRQWKSYGGFTFAFKDYADAGIIPQLDSAGFDDLRKVVDPIYYVERLAALPKVVVDSSDDEFMQFDWTDIWRSQFERNTRLLIAPNSEHSLATGIPELLPCLTASFMAIAGGQPLPTFQSSYDNATGRLVVTLPAGVQHGKVVLRHAQTISKTRRDFRWVRLASNTTGLCKLPEVPLKKPVFGGNCIQPILWHSTKLEPQQETQMVEAQEGSAEGTVYTATPPEPTVGHWTGYFVEVHFTAPTGDFMYTTPGYAWPNTLPFADCHGSGCIPRLV